jgi:DNA (cytosine-5)-methyltransferase 1
MIKIGTDCSGIEAPIQALILLNIPHIHLFSSDIDEKCRLVIKNNYKCKKIFTDIIKRDHSKLPKLDLYIAGFPCQAFSGLKKNAKGFLDPRGIIFFECVKTIHYTSPKIFVFENVKGLTTHDGGKTFQIILKNLKKLEKYHIYYKILNTKDFNIPQNRPRIYIVGIKKSMPKSHLYNFPSPIPLTKKVSDFMEKSIKIKTELTQNMKNVIKNRVEKKNGNMKDNYIVNVGASVNGFGSAMKEICPCLMANAHKYYSTKYKRFLTAQEYLRLQGFPDTFKPLSDEKITKKQAGNSMSVNVLKCLFLGFLPYLKS